MSNSKSAKKQTFSFIVRGIHPDADVTVYDGYDHEVVSAVGRNLDLDLPKGLYTVRTELGGGMQEQVIRHTGATEVIPEMPRAFSAAPLVNKETSHEYYTGPSIRYSSEETSRPIGPGNNYNSRLFIFIRASNRATSRGEDLSRDLSLTDERGKIISRFGRQTIAQDTEFGWLAFSVKAAAGVYYLKYTGITKRTVPMYLYPGWQTQVFLTWHDRPLFEGMRVFMAQGAGFRPDDEVAAVVDEALNGLQNNVDLLRPRGMSLLLDEKFVNPVLGILGAHLLLRRPQPKGDLIDIVLRNLDYLIPNSPDVRALEYLKAAAFKTGRPKHTFQHPPMFRAGLEAVIAASIDDPELYSADSLFDHISTHLYVDSPWSTWEPIAPVLTTGKPAAPAKSGRETTSGAKRGATRAGGGKGKHRPLQSVRKFSRVTRLPNTARATPTRSPAPREQKLDWVQTAILDAIAHMKKSEETITVPDMARKLGVSRRAIGTALKKMDGLNRTERQKIATEWDNVGSALPEIGKQNFRLGKGLTKFFEGGNIKGL